jgi:hypothetical protein
MPRRGRRRVRLDGRSRRPSGGGLAVRGVDGRQRPWTGTLSSPSRTASTIA